MLLSAFGASKPTRSFSSTATAETGKGKTLFTGHYHSGKITSSGVLKVYGLNSSGQLGVGDYNGRVALTTVSGTWSRVKGLDSSTVGIQSDGSLWTTGANSWGELGIASAVANVPSFTKVGSSTWKEIGAGENHIVAIKSDGTLWSWGRNTYGQLGLGDTTTRTAPVQIGSDNTWTYVTAGRYHSLAIKADGTLWSWGRNSSGGNPDNNNFPTNGGQLGLGDRTDRNVPTQVGTDTDWLMVSAGFGHTAAIKSNQTLWGWGSTEYFELGTYSGVPGGTGTYQTTPIQISGDSWNTVSAGPLITYAIKNGTLWKIYSSGTVQMSNATDWDEHYTRLGATVSIRTSGDFYENITTFLTG